MKIVINSSYGGFGLSEKALEEYRKIVGNNEVWSMDRDDKVLISVIENLKEDANGDFSRLKIVEIPDGIDWEISEYDGMETIEEKHRSWC